jgi:hypothetical protein
MEGEEARARTSSSLDMNGSISVMMAIWVDWFVFFASHSLNLTWDGSETTPPLSIYSTASSSASAMDLIPLALPSNSIEVSTQTRMAQSLLMPIDASLRRHRIRPW